MSDSIPQPNLSDAIPSCQSTCRYYDGGMTTIRHKGITYVFDVSCCLFGEKEPVSERAVCLPYVRHLKLLSERRCERCLKASAIVATEETMRAHMIGWCDEWGVAIYDSEQGCSRWKAKP